MSHFYASIQGSRGEATRQGGQHISGHIRGWNLGVRVRGEIVDGEDVFYVTATTGSNGYGADDLIAIVKLDQYGVPTFETPVVRGEV